MSASIIKRTKQHLEWMSPSEGFLKLNFDGFSKGNPGSSGFSCVPRSSAREIVRILYGPLELRDSITAEVMAPCGLPGA